MIHTLKLMLVHHVNSREAAKAALKKDDEP